MQVVLGDQHIENHCSNNAFLSHTSHLQVCVLMNWENPRNEFLGPCFESHTRETLGTYPKFNVTPFRNPSSIWAYMKISDSAGYPILTSGSLIQMF